MLALFLGYQRCLLLLLLLVLVLGDERENVAVLFITVQPFWHVHLPREKSGKTMQLTKSEGGF